MIKKRRLGEPYMVMKYFLLMLLLVLTLINDILTHRLRNGLIMPFLLGGLVLNGHLDGWPGLADSLLASLMPLLFLGIFLKFDLLGKGDIKLYSAIGAIMGVGFMKGCLLYSTLVGAVIGLIILQFRHNAVDRLGYLLKYLRYALYTRSLPPCRGYAGTCKGPIFPYAYAIAGGTMIALLMI